jgi:hypothetical protein
MDILVNQSTTVEVEQLASQNLPYVIDVGQVAVAGWNAGASITADALVRPTTANQTGFVYQAGATTGQTGELEPAWPKTAGGTVIDGSVTWTAIAPPAAGEDSIASAVWSQASPPDALLTIALMATTALTASAYIGGGTSGNIYLVNAIITMHSGAIFRVAIYVSIL